MHGDLHELLVDADRFGLIRMVAGNLVELLPRPLRLPLEHPNAATARISFHQFGRKPSESIQIDERRIEFLERGQHVGPMEQRFAMVGSDCQRTIEIGAGLFEIAMLGEKFAALAPRLRQLTAALDGRIEIAAGQIGLAGRQSALRPYEIGPRLGWIGVDGLRTVVQGRRQLVVLPKPNTAVQIRDRPAGGQLDGAVEIGAGRFLHLQLAVNRAAEIPGVGELGRQLDRFVQVGQCRVQLAEALMAEARFM